MASRCFNLDRVVRYRVEFDLKHARRPLASSPSRVECVQSRLYTRIIATFGEKQRRIKYSRRGR